MVRDATFVFLIGGGQDELQGSGLVIESCGATRPSSI
jgi:hypothetical protein